DFAITTFQCCERAILLMTVMVALVIIRTMGTLLSQPVNHEVSDFAIVLILHHHVRIAVKPNTGQKQSCSMASSSIYLIIDGFAPLIPSFAKSRRIAYDIITKQLEHRNFGVGVDL